MRYSAIVHINDVLDQVVVSARIYAWDGMDAKGQAIAERTTSLQGHGKEDCIEWLADALYRFMTE